MDPRENPYAPGAGSPPPELAGRDDILRHAEIALAKARNGYPAQSLMMLGLRGVGKTVLLNRIEQMAEGEHFESAMFEIDSQRSLPALLTPQLHRLLLKLDRGKQLGAHAQRAFGLLRSFASAFKVSYGDFEMGVASPAVSGDLSIDLTDLLVAIGEASQARKTVSVILVDEVQLISRDDLSALIMALHKVSQRRLPLLLFGAGLPQLAALAGEAKSYSERLFYYPQVGQLDHANSMKALVEPAARQHISYKPSALDVIIKETEGYPFFLQVWGAHAWDVAEASPITEADATLATQRAIEELDEGFFKVRFDRLTERQQDYARAMAELGGEPVSSSAVAEQLGQTVKAAAAARDELIKKGMAYSPKRSLVAFTVPKFDEFMRRSMPTRRKQTKR